MSKTKADGRTFRDAGATFSPDRVYRYRLWRRWDEEQAPAVFCMLNPSTGNETDLDPTLRRCFTFAVEWGCGGFEIVNLFAIVSSNPSVLRTHHDPIGPLNGPHIVEAARRAAVLVCGWGAFPEARARARDVVRMLAESGCPKPKCLGINGDGSPRHPLYLRKTTKLVEWEALPHVTGGVMGSIDGDAALKSLIGETLDVLDMHEWTDVAEGHTCPSCDAFAEPNAILNHAPDCDWLRVVTRLRAMLPDWPKEGPAEGRARR